MMTISSNPEALKKFVRTTWAYQATFETPLKNLQPFVSAILSADGRLESGTITIDQIVFEPKNLKNLLKANSQAGEICRHQTLAAEGKPQTHELLVAALSDWIDFLFVPMPKPFVIYADHDEYATFYANTKSNLNLVVAPLLAGKFKQVSDYQRKF
jgi:hypothetical protein